MGTTLEGELSTSCRRELITMRGHEDEGRELGGEGYDVVLMCLI